MIQLKNKITEELVRKKAYTKVNFDKLDCLIFPCYM